MAPVFPSIFRRGSNQSCDSTASKYLSEKSPRYDDSDEPDLRDLNNALRALTEIFPDVQPEVFREMLAVFDEQSRLHVVT